MRLIIAVAIMVFCAGCSQQIVYREYYPPDEQTRLERSDGSIVGATKVEASRAGAPNWSDNKSLNISFFGF